MILSGTMRAYGVVMIPLAIMAQRAGATVRTVRSAHDVMVSHPHAVVSVVLDAVRAVG